MYPSIAFNVLYQKQPQEQSVRSIRCLPERMLRDLGLSRSELWRLDSTVHPGLKTEFQAARPYREGA